MITLMGRNCTSIKRMSGYCGRGHASSIVLVLSLLTIWSHFDQAAGRSSGARFVRASRNCPTMQEISPCICKNMRNGLVITCKAADQQQILDVLNILKKGSYSIYWVEINRSYITKIPDYSFLGLEMTHLTIIRSNLSHVDRTSLSALGGKLDTLNLANNEIKEVPTEAFKMLKSLTYLNLNSNKIQVLSNSAFGGMTRLNRLTLYGNRIKHISVDAFKGMGTFLRKLNLEKNNLTAIPAETFHPLVNLEMLYLHDNDIEDLPDGLFKGLHKLEFLKLEHNHITHIQNNVFRDLNQLASLNIEHNKLVNISDGAFTGLEKTLSWLKLGFNRLDNFPSNALRPLHSLRHLDLQDNVIHLLPENAFKDYGSTLKFILLDKNNITVIPEAVFEDLHSVEWLNLSYNGIQRITDDTIRPILDTVTVIDISNNPLVCDCNILWLKEWLSNPHIHKIIKTAGDHRCMTKDSKNHVIMELKDDDVDCLLDKQLEPLSGTPGRNMSTGPGPSNGTSNYVFPLSGIIHISLALWYILISIVS